MNNLVPNKPPIDVPADNPVFKKWFEDMHRALVRSNKGEVITVTTPQTAGESFFYPLNCVTGNITFNLPAASTWQGKQYVIKKTDSSANGIIITANGTDTIEGQATYTLLSQYEDVTLYSDGVSIWYAIGQGQKYKQGTWVPVVKGGTTNPTVTYTAHTGTYVKIGRLCVVNCEVALASLTVAGTGTLLVDGLPFTCAATFNTDGGGGFMTYQDNMAALTADVSAFAQPNTTTVAFYRRAGADARSMIQTLAACGELTATSFIYFTLLYMTDR